MAVDFRNSETKENLMRAFAGESQARNRYTFGAAQARKQNQAAIAQVFLYTADQEKEHAEIFYNHLKELAGETVHVDGTYPVDLTDNLAELLRRAQHNEYEEHDDVYRHFGDKAREEGFEDLAVKFELVAKVEAAHEKRYNKLLESLQNDKTFKGDAPLGWKCRNCGYIHEGPEAPEVCPCCAHPKAYFERKAENY